MGRRRWGILGILAVLAVPLAVAATAFACARLATLKLDRAGGKPGTTVDLTGRNFNSNPTASTVKIRWNSRNGEVLWEGRPDSKGKVTGTFTVPDARPGYYVVLGTQTVASGAPAAGTPARSSVKVRRGRSSQAAAVPGPGTAAGGPSAPIVLAMTAGLLGLAGAGAWVVASARRRRSLPVLGRVA